MADEWPTASLGEVCREIYRYPSFYGMERYQDGVPVVRGEHLLPSGWISTNWSDYWFVSEEYARHFPKTRLELFDVVMSVRGSIGTFSRVGPSHVGAQISPNLIRLSPDPERIAPAFFYYALRGSAASAFISSTSSSSAVPAIRATDIKLAVIPLPPLPEQRAIAHILGTLDDKIELNRRMNETLEVMARAIFKSWFVDFDPVRAKARGEQPAGLAPEIAVLFPDALVETELGEVPEGWEVIGLNETATFLNGLALQKYPPDNGDSLPVIKIAQLRKGSTESADRASAEITDAYVVEDGDVLFSWSGSLECVLWTGGRGALNQHLFKVASDRFPKWFYYLWIHQHLSWFQTIAAGKATTMGHIQRHHLAEAKVSVPPPTILVHADQVLGPMLDALVSRALESRTLAALRDTLLPKLISGELRVADAERIIGGSI